MTRVRFERLVEEALTLIPERFRREMQNVAVVVEDEPSDALLDELIKGTGLTKNQFLIQRKFPDVKDPGK